MHQRVRDIFSNGCPSHIILLRLLHVGCYCQYKNVSLLFTNIIINIVSDIGGTTVSSDDLILNKISVIV